MRYIRITDLIPPGPLRESESARIALVGAELYVDTDTVRALRSAHPKISPPLPDTYEATLDQVLYALHELDRSEAAADWNIIAPRLIRIPFDCAKVIGS